MRHIAAILTTLIWTSAHADTPDYEALDVHALLDSITDAQKAEFHIAITKWKESAPAEPAPLPSVAIPFPHAYIVGSLEGVATYNQADSSIDNLAELSILPTTY